MILLFKDLSKGERTGNILINLKTKEAKMNTYITLMNLTDQGAKDLKAAPKRIEDGLKMFE